MPEQNLPPTRKSQSGGRTPNLRGYTLQLFLITVLPLTALLLAVAFGSQTLHHAAMRSLVGDRDLRTARAASLSINRELTHLITTLQILSRSIGTNSDLSPLILNPVEITASFDGGIAVYSPSGSLISASSREVDWAALPAAIPATFSTAQNSAQASFSALTSSGGTGRSYIFISLTTAQKKILVGAFSPEKLIVKTLGELASSNQTTVVVISPGRSGTDYSILYRAGPIKIDENSPDHPGIRAALSGKNGIDYFQGSEGEHVVAFSPVPPAGWGLVIEEAWEDIASPYLMTTQSAPLVIVPAFLLALLAIWFGARWIVTPLQNLEKQAADLAAGNFDAIQQPVGGIEEIRNLQAEMADMAGKLKAAQLSLRNYIGAITAGVESERNSLARELHDDTIQALIALNQRIQMAQLNAPASQKAALSELQTLVQQSMENLRRIIRGLRPIYLEDLGLIASLEMLAREINQTSGIPITFSATGMENRLNAAIEMSLYRMVQEALNNVARHSGASQAWVELEFTPASLIVQIRDNGKGFIVPQSPSDFPEKGHFGLLGLHERAEIIDAELEITSSLGKGTNILIRVLSG